MHRDLKGENVLVDPETGDLIVLGMSIRTSISDQDEKRQWS